MTEPFVPLTVLSEPQRAQALERFTIIHSALEDGACLQESRKYNPTLDQTLLREGPSWVGK